MLTIRLHRTGRRNHPSFKIVVTDKRNSSTAGRFVEEVGFYNPATKEKVMKKERILYWIGVGAQPSPTVWNLCVKEKIVQGTKLPKHKKPKLKEGEQAKTPATSVVKEVPAEKPVVEETKKEAA